MRHGKGNLYLTKNRFGRKETCCAENNHSYSSNISGNSQIRTLIKELLAKYRILKKLPKISHIKKLVILEV